MNRQKMILYDACPSCGQKNIVSILSSEDYTVSHKRFDIWECKNCTLRFTQNVPAADEISPYYQSENYISHSDTNKGLINTLYHKVRNRTLVQKRKMIQKLTGKSMGNILDVGGGTGAFLNTMQQAGWQTTGLEPDETARRKALELYNLNLESSGKLFSLPPQSFDAITMWHVLEHVHELHAYIKKLKELLKPGGKLFIAVPNYTCYDEKTYKEFWAAYDVPRHLYHFSPASMKTLLSSHSMQVNNIKPMRYDSFYVSMLSEKYKTGKSNFLKAFIVGSISNFKAMFNKEKCSSVIYVAAPSQPFSEREGTNL
jgi:2-polyprenyl-3-methyl-5-hydroxy-6-metoxy-1,4-benzoquinol methylase